MGVIVTNYDISAITISKDTVKITYYEDNHFLGNLRVQMIIPRDSKIEFIIKRGGAIIDRIR